MRCFAKVLFAVVLCAAVVGAASSAVGAQNKSGDPSPVPVIPPSCDNVGPYDLNRDGRLTSADLELWVRTVHESGRCGLNGPVSSVPVVGRRQRRRRGVARRSRRDGQVPDCIALSTRTGARSRHPSPTEASHSLVFPYCFTLRPRVAGTVNHGGGGTEWQQGTRRSG